jgi:hypothetical protein
MFSADTAVQYRSGPALLFLLLLDQLIMEPPTGTGPEA